MPAARKGLILAALVCGCGSEPVRISDECVATSEPTLLRSSAGLQGRWSIGFVEGSVLLSYVTVTRADGAASVRAQWFDASLHPTTEDFALGDGRAVVTPDWIASDGALWAQIWIEAEQDVLSPPRRAVSIFRLSPNVEAATRAVPPLASLVEDSVDGSEGLTPISCGASAGTAGVDGRAPAAIGPGGPMFVLNGWPASCGRTTAHMRLMTFDATRAEVDLSGVDPCAESEAVDGRAWAHNARLVRVGDNAVGVFFRQGFARGQGHLHYSRIDSDLRLVDTPPRQVDFTTIPWSIPGGFQPQAVALGDDTLLFSLRNADSSTNECQDLRLVDPDGQNPRDAPYQMSCRPPRDALRLQQNGPTLSAWVILQPLSSGHAVMAYGERTNYSPPGTEYARRLTATTPWQEGVFVHTLDEEGRRASDVVRVSAPESTAMVNPTTPRTETDGPFPGEFEVQAVSEGDRVVVAWWDNRPDAPGYYARSFRCTALPTE